MAQPTNKPSTSSANVTESSKSTDVTAKITEATASEMKSMTIETRAIAPKSIEFIVYLPATDALQRMTADQIGEIPHDVKFDIYHSEAEAHTRREEVLRSKVLREAQVKRARAKTEAQRARFRGQHPNLARELERREETARESASVSVEKAKIEAKTRIATQDIEA